MVKRTGAENCALCVCSPSEPPPFANHAVFFSHIRPSGTRTKWRGPSPTSTQPTSPGLTPMASNQSMVTQQPNSGYRDRGHSAELEPESDDELDELLQYEMTRENRTMNRQPNAKTIHSMSFRLSILLFPSSFFSFSSSIDTISCSLFDMAPTRTICNRTFLLHNMMIVFFLLS